MTALQDVAGQLTLTNVLPTAARTATANGTGFDAQTLRGRGLLILDSAAGTGTSPTLDVTIEDSADNSAYAAVSGLAFTRVINAASRQSLSINLDGTRRYIRAVSTIGGTTPSFTFSVNLVSL